MRVPALTWLLLVSCATPAPSPVAAPAAPAPSSHAAVLPRGDRLVVQLDRELATSGAHAGDRVTARVVAPVGSLEPEARARGVVTESRRGDEENDPVLRLRFYSIERPGDRRSCRTPLSARVTSAELQSVTEPHGHAESGAAVSGALVGGLMLGLPGALDGFGIGMTGGAVHELRGRAADALLPEGALLTLQLQAPLDLRGC